MRYLKFLLISSLLLTCTPASKDEHTVKERNLLADIDSLDIRSDRKVDSILAILAKGDTSLTPGQYVDVHLLLQKIIDEKASALEQLDKINEHMDSIEYKVEEYVKKKKASAELKKKLLQDIQRLKEEINEIKPRTLQEVVQKPIPNHLKSLSELPAGNYRARIDRTHILQFFIDEKGEIFVAPLILDSTTVFNSGTPLNPKVAEQIQKIKEQLKNN